MRVGAVRKASWYPEPGGARLLYRALRPSTEIPHVLVISGYIRARRPHLIFFVPPPPQGGAGNGSFFCLAMYTPRTRAYFTPQHWLLFH